jgi:hypothetical protein
MVNFVVIWYIFSRFGMFYQEKSGNPGAKVFFIGRKECEQKPLSWLLLGGKLKVGKNKQKKRF